MKTRYKFLIPNKKTAVIFAVLSTVMGLAILQLDSFYPEPKFSVLYSVLWPFAEPTLSFWMFLSGPVLFFTDGIIPQSTIRWFRIESWEMTYGINFVYYYFIALIGAYFWNTVGKHRNVIRK